MPQTFSTRFAAFVLAAVIVTAAWLPTVTVPLTGENAAFVSTVA